MARLYVGVLMLSMSTPKILPDKPDGLCASGSECERFVGMAS